MLIRLLFCWLFVFALALPAQAEEALVLGEAVVPDRGNAARAVALPAALLDALAQLTPEAELGANESLAAALAGAEDLLHRFDYQQVTRPTASGIPSIKLMLRAWFRAAAARELLVRAGLPVWRGGRMEMTLWPVAEGADGRRLLDGATEPALQPFAQALSRRGVTLLWPLNDLDDWRMAESLTPDGIAEALAGAAARSATDVAALVLVRSGEEGVGIDWYVHDADAAEPARFSSSGADLAEALTAGQPRLVALLGERHAAQPRAVAAAVGEIERGPGEYVIWLENLQRADAYAAANGLLAGLSVVDVVTPEQASGDRVRVRVRLNAPLGQLLALLAADGRLAPSDAPPGDADLSLRWQD